MSIKILSWNMYYGDLSRNDSTPAGRFNHIIHLAVQNSIDVIFLQEHPGISSQFTNPEGYLTGTGGLTPNYEYFVFQEMANDISNRYNQSNRAYAVILRKGFQLNMSYFHQNSFVNNPQLESRLRCPIQCEIIANDITYNFFNWHNETGNMAQQGIDIFTELQQPPNTVLVGDLNMSANRINQIPFFTDWYDVVVNDENVNGVDHIMSLLNCTEILSNELDFWSDSNHYPIAAQIGQVE
jgi:hypothetical protein